MKKLMFVFLMLFSVNALSATAVVRQGVGVDQYKIEDPGGDYDNYLIIIANSVNEVLIQVSSVNFHTSKESLLCWTDSEILECPDDDLDPPNEAWRMPILKLLADIQIAGGVTVGADLTDLAEKSIFLGFWHEYRTHKVVEDSIAEMVLEGLNELQQRRALKYIYFGLGIDLVTAQSIANNRIINSIAATYDEYNLATVPLQDRRLLKLFGAVGAEWFE